MSGRDPLQMTSFPTEVMSQILTFIDYRALRRESATRIQARCRGVLDRQAIKDQLAWMSDEDEDEAEWHVRSSDDYDSEEEDDHWSRGIRVGASRYRYAEVGSPRGRWS